MEELWVAEKMNVIYDELAGLNEKECIRERSLLVLKILKNARRPDL